MTPKLYREPRKTEPTLGFPITKENRLSFEAILL